MEDRLKDQAWLAIPPIYTGSKDEKKIQKAAYAAGWRPKAKKSGVLWLSPDGTHQVLLHGSSSDHRALANMRSEFRRGGLNV